MSSRDAESGSSSYKGGSGAAGGLGNGGIGGGMGGGGNYGGGYGGGAGRNGGMASGTGLTTGNNWYGNTAFGQAGGFARGYATRDPASLRNAGMAPTMGSYSNFNQLNGQPMFNGALSGQSFNGMNANAAYGGAAAQYAAMQAAKQNQPHPGVNPTSDETILSIEDVPPAVPGMPSAMYQPWLNKISAFRNQFTGQNPSWGPITDVYSRPDPNDLSSLVRPGGAPLNVPGVMGGMGVPGYSGSRDMGNAANRRNGGGGGW